MANYNAREIEKKWQKWWEENNIYKADFSSDKPKYYNLTMFPYPSGDKLHVGHWYNYSIHDSWGRLMRLKGYNVFEPIGYDSFGLPAENYAFKTGIHPDDSTNANIETMTRQLKEIGCMYDWDYSVVTSRADYYKWTQWLFLQLYKHGFAYRKNAPVNWCPSDQTVLANEQVVEGKCERCGSEVTKKNLTQWFFKIRDYADKLLNFEGLNWPEKTMLMQKNWIGRSEGAEVYFKVKGFEGELIKVFTTRIDTLSGVTYVVLAPEHELVEKITADENKVEMQSYIEKTKHKNDIERAAEGKEKTGIPTGAIAINPLTGEEIPIWVSDYVLASYGTGAVMAVPAHDERDYEFAKKYKLPLKWVIKDCNCEPGTILGNNDEPYVEYGELVNSGEFDGLMSEEAKSKIVKKLEASGEGKLTVQYKFRDWLVSRQRYWGAPIPVMYDENDEVVPVDEADLPVLLPRDVDFKPKGDGKSPLNTSPTFVNVEYKGRKLRREVDTLDTFVDSSWYFLRYMTAMDSEKAFDRETVKKWMPVDMYIGGAEHACMHLLYARFFNQFLFDHGYIDHKEPFKRLFHQGIITKNGSKMSKSKGNVVSPDEYVEKYGSDVFRMYLMFLGPYSEGGDWSDKGITGVARFVERFYNLMSNEDGDENKEKMLKLINRLVKKVSEDVEKLQFNTCVAAFMQFLNEIGKIKVDKENKLILCRLLAPFAPHLAEECFQMINGGGQSVFNENWPKFDEKYLVESEVTVVVQINGKVRGQIVVPAEMEEDEIFEVAVNDEKLKQYIERANIKKRVYVKGRLLSLVI